MASHRPLAVCIETHGCKLNQADSQDLASNFTEAGYILAQSADHADVFVINTCTVTHVADRKARQALRNARRRNPQALIVATGCYAQRTPDALGSMDGVDLVLCNTDKESLVSRVNKAMGVSEMPYRADMPIPTQAANTLRTRAMVKIQEGCDQVCSYCTVPRVRGRERSVPADVVVARIQKLVAAGYQEVVLTGTQLGTYGFEVPGASLTGLVRRVLGETPVPRLRVSSLQAQEVTPELFDLWSDARLCPHFHLPLQSGSATVLRAMRRRYSPQQYLETVELIRQRLPEASVTADVIVGFPGETERDFRETYELCSRAGLAGVHVFPYSARPGTSALYIEPKVGEQEKRNRMRKMLALAGEQAHAYRSGLVGSVRPVLWEASRLAGDATAWSGLTDTHVRVATVSPLHLSNRITATQLDRQQGEVLWGTVAE